MDLLEVNGSGVGCEVACFSRARHLSHGPGLSAYRAIAEGGKWSRGRGEDGAAGIKGKVGRDEGKKKDLKMGLRKVTWSWWQKVNEGERERQN